LSPADRKPRGAASQQKALAVALRHQPSTPDAPRVVASGRGFAAEAILQLAFANGVKVREDADLAEMLMAVGIGQEIPFAAFSAVAEILSYIYRVSQAPSGPAASPSPEVPSP
jgi:flagellar biosynthesis protein